MPSDDEILSQLKTFISWEHVPPLERLCESFVENDDQDEEAVRSQFEIAVQTCGMDICLGGTIFKKYIDFECEELADLIETQASDIEVKRSKERVVALIHRQLGLPLIGNEIALEEISILLSEYFSDKDEKLINPKMLQAKYQQGLERRAARLIYEESLVGEDSNSTDSIESNLQQLNVWQSYIKFEISENEYSRAQRLYERAVLSIPTSNELWKSFVNFSLHTLKNWQLVESVTARALSMPSSVPNDAQIWLIHALSLETLERSSELIMATLDKALYSNLSSADDYLDMQYAKANYWLRAIRKPQNDPSIELGINAFSSRISGVIAGAEALMTTYYPDWAAGWLRYYKYVSHAYSCIRQANGDSLSTLAAKNTAKNDFGEEEKCVWEAGLSKYGSYPFIWTEFISWARNNGLWELCRKLFKRTVIQSSSLPEENRKEFAREWLLFEGECGSVNTIVQAMDILNKLPWYGKSVSQNSPGEVCQPRSNATLASEIKSSKHNKRDAASADNRVIKKRQKIEDSTLSTEIASNSSSISKSVRIIDDVNDTTSVESNILKKALDESLPASTDHVRVNDDSSNGVDTFVENHRVLIRNLPFTASSDDVRAVLSTCGELNRFELILSKSEQSRGLAVAEFASAEGFSAALTLTGTKILDRLVNIEPLSREAVLGYSIKLSAAWNDNEHQNEVECAPVAIASTDINTESPSKALDNTASDEASTPAMVPAQHPTTVFVSKLPASLTNEGLRSLFASCGNVLESRLAIDKKTRESKCHGLVQFVDEAGKKAALKMNKQKVEDVAISVLPSKFAAVSEPKVKDSIRTQFKSGISAKNEHPQPGALSEKPVVNKYLAHLGVNAFNGEDHPRPHIRLKEAPRSATPSSALMFKPRAFRK